MHRLTGQDLHDILYVAIRTAPKRITSKLAGKLPVEGDAATRELVRLIAARIDNGSTMVIRADLVRRPPYGEQPGEWGVSEPDPTA